MGQKMLAVAEEGIRSGELIPVESSQVTYAALGANVFYFLSAPMMRLIAGGDPMERSALEFRRKVSIEYLGQAIFIDRERGAQAAARVLADTPMPERIDAPGDEIFNLRLTSVGTETVANEMKRGPE
jgi:TetR/AcrR family transcriptional regulator